MAVETLTKQSDGKAYAAYYNKTYLRDFLPLITPPGNVIRHQHEHREELSRFGRQLELIQEHLPRAWYIGDFILSGLLPGYLQEKIYSPENLPHGIQHFNRVSENSKVASVYTPEIIDLPSGDSFDFCLSLEAGAIGHDLLQVDSGQKLGHAELGSVFVPGLMKLAQLCGVGEINDRQLPLVAEAIYHHSNPENGGRRPDTPTIIGTYQEKFGKHPEEIFPSLKWLAEELRNQGCDLYSLDLTLPREDKYLAKLVAGRLVAADKRDANAPPFMANLRTIMTAEERPFADFTQGIERHQRLIEAAIGGNEVKDSDFFDDVSRIYYELARDPRKGGMLSFEISWFYDALKRREEYTREDFAEGLLSGNLEFLTKKYYEWITVLEKEALAEGRLEESGTMVGLLDVLAQRTHWISIKPHLFSDERTKTLALAIAQEYQHAFKVLRQKSRLQQKIVSGNTDIFWKSFAVLHEYFISQRQYLRAPKHPPIPELPVYVATYGVN